MITQLVTLAFATLCFATVTTPARSELEDAIGLKEAFNGAKGKVRVVMLVSPTCPACISGADVMRNEVVGKLKDRRLATFSVFIPMLLTDGSERAVESAKKMKEAGIPAFWDGNRTLGKAYGKTVKLPNGNKIAGDVYFIYGPKEVWGNTPPKPEFWMHQLAEDDRCLDPAKFRAAVQAELGKLK